MDICVFGASNAYGAFDREESGWVGRLRKYAEGTVAQITDTALVYNCGVSGDTTKDLLKRFEVEYTARIKDLNRRGQKCAIIFEIGKNDCAVDKRKEVGVPLKTFGSNLKKLMKLARRFTSKIVFMTITPVDERYSAPWIGDRNLSYKNENVKRYNPVLRTLCSGLGVPLADTFWAFSELDCKPLLEDGVHLNSRGHQKLFEIIKPILIKNKIL